VFPVSLFTAAWCAQKRVLFSQVFAIVAMVGVVWCLYGYSMAFMEAATGGSLAEATILAGFPRLRNNPRRWVPKPG
jgi:ammonia channel protein AmtB